jgi:DNA-binding HxlR family transcriptional regulator
VTAKRRYRLLCPIARTLDVLGDRWSLLIVRDLHAGPARYQDLEEGLGIATNLLATRLLQLTEAGVIRRSSEQGSRAYELTDLGRRTDRILWELSRFGANLAPEPEPRRPGNLRLLTLPLRLLLESVEDRPELVARLLVDDDAFTIISSASGVQLRYNDQDPDVAPDLVIQTDYEGLLDAGEGRLAIEQFAADHVEIVTGDEHAGPFLTMMARAFGTSDRSR